MADQESLSIEITTTLTADQARDFVYRAAHDDDFRERLAEEPQEVLDEYGIEISGIPLPSACQPPPKHLCEKLLARLDEINEYADAEYAPVALTWIVMTIGYAMPLVVTTEHETVAAR